MPWKRFGKCVHKLNGDGSMGELVACHDTTEEADAQVRALYANTEGKSMDVDELKAVTKKEADGEHPASHYLVVEDGAKPSTWHLRIKGTDGKPEHRLMGAAWAALHGGYRGNKYEGPNKSEAISKLEALYKSEGLPTPSKSFKMGMMDTPTMSAYGATTMADAIAAQDAKEQAHELMELVGLFGGVVDEICYSDMVQNKKVAIASAADELSKLLSEPISEPDKPAEGKTVDFMEIKSLGNDRVGGYAVLWGSDTKKDLTGEWFTPKTAELTAIYDTVGRLPFLYHHGMDDALKTTVIGVVDTLKADSVGLWYEAQLKLADEYGEYVKKLLADGKLKTSSQTFAVARNVDKSGEIMRWPIVEITATPAPAEYRMQPIELLKSAYQEIGCTDFSCVLKKFGVESEGDNQGVVKARLLAELENLRIEAELL